MARTPKKSLAVAGNNLPTNWEAELAKHAQRSAAQVASTGGGNFISTKGGEFTYKGDVLPQPMDVVVIDFINLNTWYGNEPYDEKNPQPPVCYAMGREVETMKPHPNAPDPQAEYCKDCDQNKFGTDIRGRGKACKNQFRLAMVDAHNPQNLDEGAEVAQMSIPPGSIKYWSGLVKKLSNVLNAAPIQYVVQFTTEKLGGGHAIKCTLGPILPKPILQKIFPLIKSVEEDLMAPFPEKEEKPAPRARATRTGAAARGRKY